LKLTPLVEVKVNGLKVQVSGPYFMSRSQVVTTTALLVGFLISSLHGRHKADKKTETGTFKHSCNYSRALKSERP